MEAVVNHLVNHDLSHMDGRLKQKDRSLPVCSRAIRKASNSSFDHDGCSFVHVLERAKGSDRILISWKVDGLMAIWVPGSGSSDLRKRWRWIAIRPERAIN